MVFINPDIIIYVVQFQKISILSPLRGLEFPGGWGFRFCKAKKIEKKFMKLN